MGEIQKGKLYHIVGERKKIPLEVILDYLLEDDRKRMKALLIGLETSEYQFPKIVKTAVTCNLYKIFYSAGRLTTEHPQKICDAAVAMSFNQINALVTTLCATYIKKIIKNQEYEQ